MAPGTPAPVRHAWVGPVLVFVFVLAVQLWLVRGAGTDVPFQDQWQEEGGRLYPAWRAREITPSLMLAPHNEHRIAWTRALDLLLFAINRQWDPLVQLAAGAVLRAIVAALLAAALSPGFGARGRMAVATGIGVAFLPQLAWHNALWGFQSQVYFVLLFSVLALLCFLRGSGVRIRCVGIASAAAALLAMAPGAFVGVALVAVVLLRIAARRAWAPADGWILWPALAILAMGIALAPAAPQHAPLHPDSLSNLLRALAMLLAWPHTGQPLAALILCAPLCALVFRRVWGRRAATPGEDFVIAIAIWAIAAACAIAWSRGASPEMQGGVPSRYADFLVLLPVANAWCAVALLRSAAGSSRRWLRLGALVWVAFLGIGWVGLSAEMLRGVILPRFRDRDAPVRIAVAFQRSGDPAAFNGVPRLLVPDPNPRAVGAVLSDPRMRGALPPSFQPGEPMGPLSTGVRRLLGR